MFFHCFEWEHPITITSPTPSRMGMIIHQRLPNAVYPECSTVPMACGSSYEAQDCYEGKSCCRSAMLKHESRDYHSEVETGIPSAPELVVRMNDRIIDFARNVNR